MGAPPAAVNKERGEEYQKSKGDPDSISVETKVYGGNDCRETKGVPRSYYVIIGSLQGRMFRKGEIEKKENGNDGNQRNEW